MRFRRLKNPRKRISVKKRRDPAIVRAATRLHRALDDRTHFTEEFDATTLDNRITMVVKTVMDVPGAAAALVRHGQPYTDRLADELRNIVLTEMGTAHQIQPERISEDDGWLEDLTHGLGLPPTATVIDDDAVKDITNEFLLEHHDAPLSMTRQELQTKHAELAKAGEAILPKYAEQAAAFVDRLRSIFGNFAVASLRPATVNLGPWHGSQKRKIAREMAEKNLGSEDLRQMILNGDIAKSDLHNAVVEVTGYRPEMEVDDPSKRLEGFVPPTVEDIQAMSDGDVLAPVINESNKRLKRKRDINVIGMKRAAAHQAAVEETLNKELLMEYGTTPGEFAERIPEEDREVINIALRDDLAIAQDDLNAALESKNDRAINTAQKRYNQAKLIIDAFDHNVFPYKKVKTILERTRTGVKTVNEVASDITRQGIANAQLMGITVKLVELDQLGEELGVALNNVTNKTIFIKGTGDVWAWGTEDKPGVLDAVTDFVIRTLDLIGASVAEPDPNVTAARQLLREAYQLRAGGDKTGSARAIAEAQALLQEVMGEDFRQNPAYPQLDTLAPLPVRARHVLADDKVRALIAMGVFVPQDLAEKLMTGLTEPQAQPVEERAAKARKELIKIAREWLPDTERVMRKFEQSRGIGMPSLSGVKPPMMSKTRLDYPVEVQEEDEQIGRQRAKETQAQPTGTIVRPARGFRQWDRVFVLDVQPDGVKVQKGPLIATLEPGAVEIDTIPEGVKEAAEAVWAQITGKKL